MDRQVDLVVIGTGSAGTAAATRCRQAGWSVAIADERPFGGTCALRGCDPKKVLVGVAAIQDAYTRLAAQEIMAGEAVVQWPALMRFKRSFTDPVPARVEGWLDGDGITTYHGPVSFEDATTVKIGSNTLGAKHVLIASGAVPEPLGWPGDELLITSEQFLALDRLPPRVVFVGGGYISFEFAHIAARAGAAVTILHRGPHPLGGFDPDLVQRLVEVSRAQGLDVRLNAAVTRVEAVGAGFRVHIHGDEGVRVVDADLVVHGAGRRADLAHLGLERVAVPFTRRGVTVTPYLQSVGNSQVYAAGDAADTPGAPLTPVAGMEGMAAALNLLEGPRHLVNYQGIPTIVYTIPPLAAVGLREQEAADAGLDYVVHQGDMTGWYSSRRLLAPAAGYKVLVDRKTDRILGAHVLGPHAEELINLFALALRQGLTATTLRQQPFAYPTGASDLAYMLG